MLVSVRFSDAQSQDFSSYSAAVIDFPEIVAGLDLRKQFFERWPSPQRRDDNTPSFSRELNGLIRINTCAIKCFSRYAYRAAVTPH